MVIYKTKRPSWRSSWDDWENYYKSLMFEDLTRGWDTPLKQIKPLNLSLGNHNLRYPRQRESRELSITPQ